jgi:hypothetical protein
MPDPRIQAVIDRLEAWIHGERIAQQSAEHAGRREIAETHWNQLRNYQGLVDTLKDFQDDE